MKVLAFLLGFLPIVASAALIHGKDSSNNDQVFRVNSSGQATIALLAGEDQTNGVMKVEHQYSKCRATADTQCKNASGYLHAVVCSGTDAAAQAGGAVTIYDNTAESGDVLYVVVPAAAAFTPVGAIFDIPLGTGLYIGFPAGATDIVCTASYR